MYGWVRPSPFAVIWAANICFISSPLFAGILSSLTVSPQPIITLVTLNAKNHLTAARSERLTNPFLHTLSAMCYHAQSSLVEKVHTCPDLSDGGGFQCSGILSSSSFQRIKLSWGCSSMGEHLPGMYTCRGVGGIWACSSVGHLDSIKPWVQSPASIT